MNFISLEVTATPYVNNSSPTQYDYGSNANFRGEATLDVQHFQHPERIVAPAYRYCWTLTATSYCLFH
jgi:hypothetical protein